MNLEKFTERSRGFIQAAQTIAMRESHQRLAPEHLLKAIMDDEQGLASNPIRPVGGGARRRKGGAAPPPFGPPFWGGGGGGEKRRPRRGGFSFVPAFSAFFPS